MRIAQISDLHYTSLTMNPFRLFPKRVLAHLNWLIFRRKLFSEKQLASLPRLFKKLDVDLVVFGGDFTTTSMPEEFEKAAQFVKKVKVPWVAIPGNHDRYTKASCKKKLFYDYFTNKKAEVTHEAQVFNLKEHRVEAHPLKKGWWLICLDTSLATGPYSSGGLFSEDTEKNLLELLSFIPKEDSLILLNHFPFFENEEERRSLIRRERLENILKKTPRIKLYLHGHTHRHTVADLQGANLPLVLDSGSSSQNQSGSWNLIDLEDGGCRVTPYRWKEMWQESGLEEFSWKR